MDRRDILRGAILAAGVSMASHASAKGDAGPRILVDAGRDGADIRPMMAVAGVPGPIPGRPQFMDMGDSWSRGHVRMVRSHDWVARLDTVDNPDSLFPRWDADPHDPASYNFTAADLWVAQVNRIGAQVLFTIASAIPRNKLPAADLAKYEVVVEHIVRHFAQGWGKRPDDGAGPGNVRHWEFGDQPDFGKLHFAGTTQQFHAMYAAFARAVKRVDPGLQTGGPGLAFPLNADGGHREAFLDFLRQNDLPLDFFSYNWFSDGTRDPMDQRVVAQRLRAVLDARGFQKTALVADSWNYLGIPVNHAPPAEAAAYLVAAGIYLVDSPLDRACYFRGDGGWDPHYGFQDPAGYLGPDGRTDQRMLAVESLGQALNGKRLEVRGGDEDGLAVLASRDGADGTVRVLVANHVRPAAFALPRPSDTLSFRVPIGAERVQMDFLLPPQRPAPTGPRPSGLSLTVLNRLWRSGRVTVKRLLVDRDGAQRSSFDVAPRKGGITLDAPVGPNAFALFEIHPA